MRTLILLSTHRSNLKKENFSLTYIDFINKFILIQNLTLYLNGKHIASSSLCAILN